MFLNDDEILELGRQGMIRPFNESQIFNSNYHKEKKTISSGLSSFGYDLSLSSLDFRIFRKPNLIDRVNYWLYDNFSLGDSNKLKIVDPKNFNSKYCYKGILQSDSLGFYFVLPARASALGVAVEKLSLPRDITALCIGKSTYARCGIIANVTSGEAGWEGHLTLELANLTDYPCKLYTDEGILQIHFVKGNPCKVSYADRKGKYQNQYQFVTYPM